MMKKTGTLTIALLLLASVSGAYAFWQKIAFIEKIVIRDGNVKIQEGSSYQLSFDVQPAKADEKVIGKSSDNTIATVTNGGKVTAFKEGKVKITLMGEISGVSSSIEVTVVKKNAGASTPSAPKKPTYSKGTVRLEYGTYKGDLKNGIPHGHGILTYTEEHQIVSSKSYVAQPGDIYEGEFRDGKIAGGIGYWLHDGRKTVIMP